MTIYLQGPARTLQGFKASPTPPAFQASSPKGSAQTRDTSRFARVCDNRDPKCFAFREADLDGFLNMRPALQECSPLGETLIEIAAFALAGSSPRGAQPHSLQLRGA